MKDNWPGVERLSKEILVGLGSTEETLTLQLYKITKHFVCLIYLYQYFCALSFNFILYA